MPISNQIPSSRLIQPGVVDSAATRPASPFEGQAIYQKDTDEVLYYNGSSWSRPWNMPWGVVGKAQNTSDFTLSSTSTAVTNCSVTWTAVSNRLYKTTAYFYYQVTSGTGVVIGQIFNGSGGRLQEGGHYAAATSYVSIALTLYESGLSGSQTRRLQALYLAGGISASAVIGNSGYPTQIIVEDIGPA